MEDVVTMGSRIVGLGMYFNTVQRFDVFVIV